MRVVKSVLLAIMFLLISNGMQAQSGEKLPDTNKRMPFEHGTYVQVLNIVGMDGNTKMIQTVYFDRWGEWVAAENQSDTNTDNFKIHKLTIIKGNIRWGIDLITKTGEMIEFPAEYIESLRKTNDFETALTYFKEMFGKEMELKEMGEEEYLGYICKKTYIKYPTTEPKSRKQKKKQTENAIAAMEITALTYGNGNFPMKTDMKLNIEGVSMEMSLKTISINLDAPPASVFEVPDDVEIEFLDEEVGE